MSEKRVNNTNCSVFGCNSKKSKDPNIHFHHFPGKMAQMVHFTNNRGIVERVDRRRVWENVLLYGKPVNKYMRVCSLHFKKEDYHSSHSDTMSSPRLKKTAIPSQNLPKKRQLPGMNDKEVGKQRKRRNVENTDNKENLFEDNALTSNVCAGINEDKFDSQAFEQILNDNEKSAVMGLLKLCSNVKTFVSKETQVCSGDLMTSFASGINTDNDLNSLTGIPSIKLLNTFCLLIKEHFPDKKSHKLSIKDRIILVFMKLKTGVTFKILSFLFKVSPSSVRLIFDEYISCLAKLLETCIVWPTREERLKNLPKSFSEFSSVAVILDCTEIPIQTPSCLCCRIKTYSHYKKGQTLKFMTGVSPGGIITFVSKAFGGRSSDKAIFEQSHIIDKLTPTADSVMVDKGFLIEDICQQHFIKLVRPEFLRKKKQFSREEALSNVSISKARVHIERMNQRIKTFNILNSTLQWVLVNKIDEIFTVVCSITNLQSSIFGDDKFLL